jgi:CD109 antigen
MVGGLNGNLALTAFVTNALLEYGSADRWVCKKPSLIWKARFRIEKADSYALAQISYALVKAGSSKADSALDQLLKQASADSNGMYWEPHSIESTGYAAMALALKNRIEAQSALQWLAAQRNSLGGFGSTQDTVVAFKASPPPPRNSRAIGMPPSM